MFQVQGDRERAILKEGEMYWTDEKWRGWKSAILLTCQGFLAIESMLYFT